MTQVLRDGVAQPGRLINPDGPEAAAIIMEMVEALEGIAAGSALGIEMFEARVHDRKDRLTWYAVNVLQDNLAACKGTADTLITKVSGK